MATAIKTRWSSVHNFEPIGDMLVVQSLLKKMWPPLSSNPRAVLVVHAEDIKVQFWPVTELHTQGPEFLESLCTAVAVSRSLVASIPTIVWNTYLPIGLQQTPDVFEVLWHNFLEVQRKCYIARSQSVQYMNNRLRLSSSSTTVI